MSEKREKRAGHERSGVRTRTKRKRLEKEQPPNHPGEDAKAIKKDGRSGQRTKATIKQFADVCALPRSEQGLGRVISGAGKGHGQNRDGFN